MDPFSPATPPATKQDNPSPTRPADEDEVVASLLLLKEVEGETALQEDKENQLVPDESKAEAVNMDVEKEALDKTLVVTSSLEEFSDDEALDEEENRALDEEGDDEALESEEDDDDGLDEEEVDEYDIPAEAVTEEVRRCNRSNGRGWICPEVAEPGFLTCLRHIISRREAYQRFQSRKLQRSTGGSEATVVDPRIEDAATSSAVGDQEEAVGPYSPGTLACAKQNKAEDPSEPDDEAA